MRRRYELKREIIQHKIKKLEFKDSDFDAKYACIGKNGKKYKTKEQENVCMAIKNMNIGRYL